MIEQQKKLDYEVGGNKVKINNLSIISEEKMYAIGTTTEAITVSQRRKRSILKS